MPPLSGILRRLRPRRPDWTALGWIAFSSLAWALCYPPFPLGPLAFAVLVPAFIATLRLNPRRAFMYHFAGGVAYNLIMYWWIYNVMKVGPALVIGAGLVLLILFLSLFNALLGWLFRILADIRFGLLAFPILWGGLETLRSLGEMSFPWNNMGYALGHHASLIQSASYLGIYGLSMAVIASNCLAFTAWRQRGARRIAAAVLAAAIPLGLWVQGRFSLAAPDPLGAPSLDISLVQPSIPQTKKWEERYFQDVMQKTWRTMMGDPGDSSILAGTDLVVLAETAVPDFLRSRPEVYERFQTLARESGADVLVGALDFIPDPQPFRSHIFYNSAFLFSARGESDSVRQYSKLRLVPFSEALPFAGIFPVINYVNLGEGDFSPGEDHALWTRGIPYSPSICYEIIYPEFVRGAKRKGARMLVNITNDGWFGYSNAPFMHANIARFRAVEAGIPIARVSNAGISLFYDYKGRILGKTRLSEVTVLRRELPLISRDTWYGRHGDAVEVVLAWLFGPGLVGCGVWAWRRGRGETKRPAGPTARSD